ncbi:hypothetical protein [Streptomyces sp. NPDC020362]|uniref:hypothetical protein n=1 Tax=unclassified Streptomyces TaxID=2593676 RepID=UPI000A4B7ABC
MDAITESHLGMGCATSTNPSDLARRIQTFEKRMTVNGMSARYRLIVDSEDGNRVITFLPAGKSYTP